MKVQVLVATMNQEDHSILDDMNIQTAVIVGNQCDRNEISTFTHRGNPVKWLSFAERGVGLNRNNALMRAQADIVMFADDDMEFVPEYEKIVTKAFEEIPQADIIIFDLIYPNRDRKPITKIRRLHAGNCMRFGAARISAKLSSLRMKGLSFNLCFGGGAQYSSGEDSLFLMDCIRKGLKVYSYPAVIARLKDRPSTWFNGYTDKYFADKGVLAAQLYSKMAPIYAAAHCWKQRKRYAQYGAYRAYRKMREGMKARQK